MVSSLNCAGIATWVYSAGTSAIRYLYVRSSFETNIQRVFKRDHFILKSVVIGEMINLVTILSHFIQPESQFYGLSPMLLYQACTNPNGFYTFPPYTIYPLIWLIILSSTITNITCNILLFKYLQNITEKTSARSEVDKKKDRKRNFVSARIGVIIVSFSIVYFFAVMANYTISFKHLDNGARAFLNAIFVDFSHCLIAPFIMVKGSDAIKRKISKVFSSLLESIKRKLKV